MTADREPVRNVPASPMDVAGGLPNLAKRLVRTWTLRTDPGEIAAGVDAIGREEVFRSSDLVAKISALDLGSPPDQGLGLVRAIVERVHSPDPRRVFGLASRVPAIEDRLAREEAALAAALADLGAERDEIARRALAGRSLAIRLREADEALEGAMRLLDLIERACGSAARELAAEAPALASSLREIAPPRLEERRRDLLTQLTVVRQAEMSFGLLLDGAEAIGRAMDRTRQTMVAALRSAVLASRAVRLGSAEARGHAAEAGLARRAVQDAVEEMRRAVAR